MFSDDDEDILVETGPFASSTIGVIRLFADYCQWCQFISLFWEL